jgi:hypothetical protein
MHTEAARCPRLLPSHGARYQPATRSGDADRDPEEDEAEPVAQLAWERPSERAQVERHERVELVELLVGGVEAGMIAALIGFGVAGGIAIVAVLAYRAFAFCIPLVPGAVTISSSSPCTAGSTPTGALLP